MEGSTKNFSSFFTVLLFLQFTAIAQYGWVEQISGTDANLNSVFFLDSLNGWIVGFDSTILKTSSGGENWLNIPSGFSNYDYEDILFTSDSIGWIVGGDGYDGVILYTSDTGQTWSKRGGDNLRYLNAITFVNNKVGYVCGGASFPSAGIILKTVDQGVTWDTIYITNYPAGDGLYDIDFVNQDVGWAVGGDIGWSSIIKKTTDAGRTWLTQIPPISYWAFFSCDFISEDEGWIGANKWDYPCDAMLYTKDGGSSWTNQLLPDSNSYISSIFFIDESTGWASDVFYKIYNTTDKGNTWTKQLHPLASTPLFYSIFLVNKKLGWIVGADGVILKTTTGGVTFIEEEEIDEAPKEFLLSQNFPNPFNPTTTISYSVPQTSQVQIKLFDVLGNEIETLMSEEKPAGAYELTWNAANLPSGVYFYQLKAGSFVETKKMILLK